MRFLKKLRRDEKGATAIEYGLIAALVAVALIPAMGTLSTAIGGTFTSVGSSMDAASGTGG